MAGKSLAQKLLIKPDHQVRLFNAPAAYHDLLAEVPENALVMDEGDGPFDLVHVFAQDGMVLNRDAPRALEVIKPGGILWISYPKRSAKVETDITRDVGWEVMNAAGWRPVTQISVDDTWSALRFRPIADVGREFRPGGVTMAAEKIMTRHPEGKEGVNIEKAKYDAVREAILALIGEHGEMPFGDLADAIGARLTDFDGSIGWYTTTVKLDLEARGEIERIPGSGPQKLRLR